MVRHGNPHGNIEQTQAVIREAPHPDRSVDLLLRRHHYRDHIIQAAKRRGVEPQFPERPDVGYRANNALCAHEDPIVKPRDRARSSVRRRARRDHR
jgi:hypothetical protein